MTESALAVAVSLALGVYANAAPVAATATFDMYNGLGFDTAGVVPTSPGTVGSDPTVTGFIDTVAGTWGVASTTPFFGTTWTASNGHLIQTAGTYSLNTTTNVVSAVVGSCTIAADGNMCFDVGAGQIAGTIDFAWGVNTGIRVVNVWNIPNFSYGEQYTVALAPAMENGPFQGFSVAFNCLYAPLDVACYAPPPTPTPVPAAGWLLGSGLIGLLGFARRRKTT